MEATLIEVISSRTNPGIDPHLHIWGWEIPTYLFLGGLVAGIMILLPALELRTGKRPQGTGAMLAPFVALGLMSLGMLALLVDLSYPTHVFRFYMSWVPSSPMSWGGWIVAVVSPALVLLGLGGLDDSWRQKLGRIPGISALFSWVDTNRRAVLWTSLLVGIALGTYTGLLLGTMPARPSWNTALLGPLFLTSGISTGAALLLLSGVEGEEQHTLVRWDTAAIAVELGLLALIGASFAGGDLVGRAAIEPVLGGAWTPAFWGLVVGAGLLVPLMMNVTELNRRLPMSRVAPVLVLCGGFVLRWILVAVGQETQL